MNSLKINPSSYIRCGVYHHFKSEIYEEWKEREYIVIGTAVHTETGEVSVIYFPLYPTPKKSDFCSRPIQMFLEEVERDGYKGPRFIFVREL